MVSTQGNTGYWLRSLKVRPKQKPTPTDQTEIPTVFNRDLTVSVQSKTINKTAFEVSARACVCVDFLKLWHRLIEWNGAGAVGRTNGPTVTDGIFFFCSDFRCCFVFGSHTDHLELRRWLAAPKTAPSKPFWPHALRWQNGCSPTETTNRLQHQTTKQKKNTHRVESNQFATSRGLKKRERERESIFTRRIAISPRNGFQSLSIRSLMKLRNSVKLGNELYRGDVFFFWEMTEMVWRLPWPRLTGCFFFQ